MKTIQVSDEDYETLMELSKEYQTQENDGNAFPYYWEAGSYRTVVNIHDEGEKLQVHDDGSNFDLDDYAESDDYENYNKFLDYWDYENYERGEYHEDLEDEWKDYIDDNIDDAKVWSLDFKHDTEHNPSFFKSDVKDFINNNKHHLGDRPGTYARTCWRMPKMEKLIKCLMRLNNIPEEKINNEALIYKKR